MYVKNFPLNPKFSFTAILELLNVATDLLIEPGYAKVNTGTIISNDIVF